MNYFRNFLINNGIYVSIISFIMFFVSLNILFYLFGLIRRDCYRKILDDKKEAEEKEELCCCIEDEDSNK